MRDLTLGSIILGLTIYGLMHPWVGVLAWTWVSIMNPHSLSWHLSSMPVAAMVGGATLVGIFVTKNRRNFFVSAETGVLMLFMLWMCITLPFSVDLDASRSLWARVMKIDLMILVAAVVLYSSKHIIALAWVLVGSVGFYGVKGGIFTLASLGNYRVWGPDGSYIEGNNEIALALVLVIPLMRFLQLSDPRRWVRIALTVAMVLCALAALGSYSRGALIAIFSMFLMLWWRSDRKAIDGLVMGTAAFVILAFMPEQWWIRMGTIDEFKDDQSATGRINAWWMAWNLAKDNFFGGGFMVATPGLFAKYAPDPLAIHAAHSIYFMVLGEHGFIGLFLFLLMWLLVWRSAGRLRIQGKNLPETLWLSNLGTACQVSLVGYATGGAFLSLSYYDLPYNLLLLVVLGCRWLDGREWVIEKTLEVEQMTQTQAKRINLGRN